MQRGGAILVLGLGNALLSDDGVGVHTIAALQAELGSHAGVRLCDGGTLGLALLPDLEKASSLIVVDAGELGGAAGEIRCFEDEAMDQRLVGKKRTAHEVAAADLLDAAALTSGRPAHRVLIAIQPASTAWGLEPTPAVRACLPELCRTVMAYVERWSADAYA
ncbi:MAG TPA: hydrogenase maturation protease [Hyphomicrobiaceae bacterium]|nr:hydrogenase maturation protease [Hyphomicrobiaceae bacterium]